MASWEDGDVEPDDAELLDWLWDIPERTAPPAAAPADIGPTRAVVGDEAGGVLPRPAEFDYPTALTPIFAAQAPRRRFSARSIGAAAAVLLVVLVGVGVGYSVFGGHNPTPNPASVTFGTSTTDILSNLSPGNLPLLGDTTTSDTSTTATTTSPSSTSSTSTTRPTTTTSRPPAVTTGTTAATTATTVRRTTTTVAGATTTAAVPVTTTSTLPIIIATVPQPTTTTSQPGP